MQKNVVFENDINEIKEFEIIKKNSLIKLEERGQAYPYWHGNPQVTIHKEVYQRFTNFVPVFIPLKITSFSDISKEFDIIIPSNINFPSYFILNMHLNEIKLSYELNPICKLEWISFLDAHIFEYIKIYHGKTYIIKINGEAIFVDNVVCNKKYNLSNFDELIIPIIHYFYKRYKIMINGLTSDNELRLVIKFRDPLKLLRIINFDDTIHECDLEKSILVNNKFSNQHNLINNIGMTVKAHILDQEEYLKFTRISYEYLLPIYDTYIDKIYTKDKNNQYIIKINKKMFLETIYVYTRGSNLIPDEIAIYEVELIVNGKSHIKFTQKLSQLTNYVEINNTNHMNENICAYHYFYCNDIHKPIIIDLTNYEEIYLCIKLDNTYDCINKELVVVFQGEKIIRYNRGLYNKKKDFEITLVPESIDEK